jgi:nicotinamide-nucleotide amidase
MLHPVSRTAPSAIAGVEWEWTFSALARYATMDMTDRLADAARTFIAEVAKRKLLIATAESCTGGLVAASITEVPGVSSVLDRGFITYSNDAKTEKLGVPAELIEAKGAVSAEVARAMAEGALRHSRADLVVAVTGIAGPDGGSAEKPVGLVHFAAARRGRQPLHEEKRFGALGRRPVQLASVEHALAMLTKLLD